MLRPSGVKRAPAIAPCRNVTCRKVGADAGAVAIRHPATPVASASATVAIAAYGVRCEMERAGARNLAGSRDPHRADAVSSTERIIDVLDHILDDGIVIDACALRKDSDCLRICAPSWRWT
jgi:hypothetical protein